MKNAIAYSLGCIGAIFALASSVFYTLFTGTATIKEFWVGILLIICAITGTSGIYFVYRRRNIGKKFLLIAGVSGIFTLFFFAGLDPLALTSKAISARVALFYFSGYILFLAMIPFFRKEF
jgi:hypothetical protein